MTNGVDTFGTRSNFYTTQGNNTYSIIGSLGLDTVYTEVPQMFPQTSNNYSATSGLGYNDGGLDTIFTEVQGLFPTQNNDFSATQGLGLGTIFDGLPPMDTASQGTQKAYSPSTELGIFDLYANLSNPNANLTFGQDPSKTQNGNSFSDWLSGIDPKVLEKAFKSFITSLREAENEQDKKDKKEVKKS